ncbi:MAG: DUF2911 domain-containing protein [Sediminibacterium sp.]
MKTPNSKKTIFSTLALLLVTSIAWSQASPAATATGSINGANVTIKYSSPSVKGRAIYGTDLVPYGGQVWRAGANSATVFETDKDLTVEGKKLPAGKYSIYAIANEKEWVIIFNSKTGQWGINRDHTTTLDPALDVIRVNVKPRKSATMNERLVYTIDNKGFVLAWENVEVPVSIK